MIVELKNSLGEHLLTYEAVRAANQKLLAAPYLQSGAPTVEEVLPQDGDFFSTADGRVLRMHMESNLPLKSNDAFSFNPWKMVGTNCLGAPNHPVLGYPRNKPEDNPGREAIILSDYSYPPILPSSLYKKCLRIIRLEHGNIFELTNILLDKLRGQQLSGGSIVMIFSAAHLARVGLKSYIKDIVTAKRRIAANISTDCYFTAAPPLLLCGTSNSELIKNVFALTGWVSNTLPDEIRLEHASDTVLDVIIENSHGGGQTFSTSRTRLPITLGGFEPSKLWTVGSNVKIRTRPPHRLRCRRRGWSSPSLRICKSASRWIWTRHHA